MRTHWLRLTAAALFMALSLGCASVGPKTIQGDQFDYAEALRDSWKEQLLLNMVGLRYAEAPMFLRVTSVINQYSIEGAISAAAPPYELQAAAAPPIGVSGRYSDRPTITYTPMTGAQFTRSVMTPIPPRTIMSLIQAGWRADILMRLAVRSINGVGASQRIGSVQTQPDFYEMVSILQDLQSAGGLSFRVEDRPPDQVALVVIRQKDSKESVEARQRLAEILNLETDRDEYRLVFGQRPGGPDEIAMLTRSILEMLVDLAMWVDVPEEHVAIGRTRPSPSPEPLETWGFKPMIRVNSSSQKPAAAFAAVRYEGVWYWIDHEDFPSKRTLSFMQLMFSLAESGAGQQAPVVTVQAGGG